MFNFGLLEKVLGLVLLLTDRISLSGCLEIFGNIGIVIICFLVCDIISFEINLTFLIKPFSYMTKKVRTKIESFSEQKGNLRLNIKHFLSFVKGFQIPEIVLNLGLELYLKVVFSVGGGSI